MKERKPFVWILAGCLIACICGVIAAISVFFWVVQPPEEMIVRFDSPETVSEGDDFSLVVRLINVGTETLELQGIYFNDSYLKGFAVNSTSPSYEDYSIQSDYFGSWHHFDFYRDLETDEELGVTFSLTALQSGSFSGPVDVCIIGNMACLRNTIRTIVE